MKTLREYIKLAEEKNIAIGHFNISNLEILHGIYNGAKRLSEEMGEKVPFIIGLSEGEEDFVGKNEAKALIESIRVNDEYPVFLDADHHYSFLRTKESIDAGFDMVVVDGVTLSLPENISMVKKCVEYAKEKSLATGRDILIEAELGFIGKSSKLIDEIPEGVNEETMTKAEDAKYFVEQTGIDLLAPSVGNVHGMVKGGNPKIHPDRIKEIREIAGVPLVLHGGSGISDNDFKDGIKAGISIIHINTELRVAYHSALMKSFNENKDEIAPYKFLSSSVEEVEKVAYQRMKLFNN